jgi:hypothetical protein
MPTPRPIPRSLPRDVGPEGVELGEDVTTDEFVGMKVDVGPPCEVGSDTEGIRVSDPAKAIREALLQSSAKNSGC